MLFSSLYTMLKLSKTTSPQKLLPHLIASYCMYLNQGKPVYQNTGELAYWSYRLLDTGTYTVKKARFHRVMAVLYEYGRKV